MDLESSLSRAFREDTLSDLVVAAFLQLPGLPVAVLTPNETRTGGDFDLELVDPTTATTIRYRIQAKRLGHPTASWETRSYHHLAHPKETGGQAAVLCNPKNLAGPIPTIPLYAFFNHQSVSSAAGVPGVALADAFDVKAIIRSSLAKKPPRFFKRMTALQHLFFDLPQILCAPTAWAGRDIASPRESRDALAEATQGRGQRGSPSAENRLISEPGPVQAEQHDALRRRDVQRIRRDSRTLRPRLIVAMGEI